MQLFPLCLLIILRMGYLLSIWEEMLVLRHCLILFKVGKNSVALRHTFQQN